MACNANNTTVTKPRTGAGCNDATKLLATTCAPAQLPCLLRDLGCYDPSTLTASFELAPCVDVVLLSSWEFSWLHRGLRGSVDDAAHLVESATHQRSLAAVADVIKLDVQHAVPYPSAADVLAAVG